MEEIKHSIPENNQKITDIRKQIAAPDCFQQQNEYNFGTHEAF